MAGSGTVVKVGGSLFSHPNFGPGLREWLASRSEERLLLVPGGAGMADTIRDFHRVHHLSQETCHWLALRTLTVSAHFLTELIPGSCVVPDVISLPRKRVAILDAFSFATADELRPGRLEHSWRVTSDSIAARVAELTKASHLLLFKSCSFDPFSGWPAAVDLGWVDAAFPELADRLTQSGCRIDALDLRARLGPEERR